MVPRQKAESPTAETEAVAETPGIGALPEKGCGRATIEKRLNVYARQQPRQKRREDPRKDEGRKCAAILEKAKGATEAW